MNKSLAVLLVLNDNAHVGYPIACDATAIPEPSTYALLFLGGAVLLLVRRRRTTA